MISRTLFTQLSGTSVGILKYFTHWKWKRSVSAPKCQFSPAGQSLIQPFLEPFEHNEGQKSSVKRLFQPKIGPISALANWTVLALVVTNLNHFHWLCLYYSVNIDKRSLDIDYINFTFILKSSFGVNKVWCMLLYGSSSRVHSDQTTYNKNLRLRTCIFSSWREKVLIYINGD